VLDRYELAAGKLGALLTRRASRDLFDTHQFLTWGNLDPKRLRVAFVVYGAMNRKDWRTVSVDDINFEVGELKNQLLPLLRKDFLAKVWESDHICLYVLWGDEDNPEAKTDLDSIQKGYRVDRYDDTPSHSISSCSGNVTDR
jgi:hypothetical protein